MPDISAAEYQRLVFEFNATGRRFATQALIVDAFEARAQQQPNHVAVELGAVRLTYAELDARANRLAHLLPARGCGPKRPVAVCLPRDPNLIVALLGIVKAGAAYVPLDPALPAERVRSILRQSGAALVITQDTLRQRFELPTLAFDGRCAGDLAAVPDTRPARSSVATDHCYILFTSGTTGGPKGVVLTHRAVVNTLEWVNRTFAVGPSDRLLFVNTPCFDLSVYDVFGALGAGATVVMASDDLLQDPAQLAHALVSQRISIWNSAPAALQQLVPFLPAAPPAHLRLVLLSGDWIPLRLPTELRRFDGVQVISLGGATEAAIWSNWFAIDGIDPNWVSIPYGKPIQNARYYVLDEQMAPVPVGAKGELYIGGVCLAEGYLGQPELTAERFMPDPFLPGERVYKTGDCARHHEGGHLELLGRNDFQVKIRGYRVELAEVELALRSLPHVAQAVCEARADASGEKALVAHVIAEPGSALDERTLHAGLAEKLPAYMLPSRIVFHATVPLSCTGKVDRQAVIASAELPRTCAGTTATRSCTEQELLGIWQRLFDRSDIGVDENFFELGGHSLLAVLLVTRIRERLGVSLPVASLLDHSSVSSLARCVQDAAHLTPGGHVVSSFYADGQRTPLILIPGVLGTVFTFRSLPQLLGSKQPAHVVDFLGDHQRCAENFHSVEAIAEYLEPHLLPLLHNGAAVLGGFSFGASVAYELAARLRNKGYEIPLLISFDGYAPGYPKRPPLSQRMAALGRSLVQRTDGDRLAQRLANVAGRIKHWMHPAVANSDRALPDEPAVDPKLHEHLMSMGRAQFRANHDYAPNFRQALDVLLIKTSGSEQPRRQNLLNAEFGWREYVSGEISTLLVPGKHLRLFDDSNLPSLARSITKHIDHLSRGAQARPSVLDATHLWTANPRSRQCQGTRNPALDTGQHPATAGH